MQKKHSLSSIFAGEKTRIVDMMISLDFLLRIAAAALLGGVIGIERGFRAKEAGFRTHFLVALGAAVFMILSAHGFEDVLFAENENLRLDVSRIAAQVVSGIGFIGAGTIIFQRQAVHGLTTAAGLWVTAAIGMAAGAGLYIIAAFTTALVLLGLEVLHSLLPHINNRNITATFTAKERRQVDLLLEQLKTDGVIISGFSSSTDAAGRLVVKLDMKAAHSKYSDNLLRRLLDLDGVEIESIE